MFKNRSKALFVASFLGLAYTVYLIVYFSGSLSSNVSTDAAAGAIATALVTPHMLMVGLGGVFCTIGFGTKKSWPALVGSILYCVGALLFIMYAPICIPLIVFGFVGYSNQKKIISGESSVH